MVGGGPDFGGERSGFRGLDLGNVVVTGKHHLSILLP